MYIYIIIADLDDNKINTISVDLPVHVHMYVRVETGTSNEERQGKHRLVYWKEDQTSQHFRLGR